MAFSARVMQHAVPGAYLGRASAEQSSLTVCTYAEHICHMRY